MMAIWLKYSFGAMLLATCVACASHSADPRVQGVAVQADTARLPVDTALVPVAAPHNAGPAVQPVVDPNNLPIAKVASMVLNDSLLVNENEVLAFMLLDSLLSPNKSSRDYYFNVFNKLMDQSGGVMDDAIGDYALTYLENYPVEFLANSRHLPPLRLESWASNIGIELFLSDGDKRENYLKSVKAIDANCKKCTPLQLARLHQFNKMVWSTIEQNLEAEKESARSLQATPQRMPNAVSSPLADSSNK